MESCNYTLYEAIVSSALDFPKGTAIYYQGRKISFKKFVKLIDYTSEVLVGTLGLKAGDTVLLSQPNIPDVLILFYALNKIGVTVDLVHPFTPYNQLHALFKKTKSKIAFLFEQRIAKEVDVYRGFADKIYITRIENYLPLIKKIIYHFMNTKIRKKLGRYIKFDGFKYVHKLKHKKIKVDLVKNDSKKVAVLLHSGSTTGSPKTICLNNDAFNFISHRTFDFLSCKPEEIRGKAMLSVLPSFHGFGFLMTMHAPMANRFACALVPKFSCKDVLDVMKHNILASMCGIPRIYEALINDPKFVKSKYIKNLMVCFCGGDSMNISLKQRFDKVMKDGGSNCQVFEGYGLTEAIAVNSVNTFAHHKDGSIGYPARDVTFKIIDENENELPRGEIGEITFKSGAIMLGYYEDEEASKATFTKDGFLKTGDLGYMDNDGFIFFKQRKKRVVKISGVGVFPSEIEQLIESVPGVINVCAIRIPDPKLVSAIKVIVVAKYFDEEGMRRSIMDTCRKYLIRWAVPKEIEFRDSLPFTLLGKVDFAKLQKEEDKKRGIN